MLAQVLEIQGATVARAAHTMIEIEHLRQLDLDNVDTVILTFLNTSSAAQARHAVRRLKRLKRKLRVGLFMPISNGSPTGLPPMDAETANADFVASSVAQAVMMGFADEKPVPLKSSPSRLAPRRAKPPIRAAAKADA